MHKFSFSEYMIGVGHNIKMSISLSSLERCFIEATPNAKFTNLELPSSALT